MNIAELELQLRRAYEERAGKIINLYQQGYSLREIAKKFDVSMQRIHEILVATGHKRRGPHRGVGMTPEQRKALK